MFRKSTWIMLQVLVANTAKFVAGPPPAVKDPFLDNFIGEWSVARKMGNGRAVASTVRCEWVLKHQFIQLHYGAGENEPEYSADVFIGFDDSDHTYVCHWVDIFGGRYSLHGRGKTSEDKQAIEFHFDSKEGAITNRFMFDPQTKSWTSLIRQEENGEWKTFAEEKWTKK